MKYLQSLFSTTSIVLLLVGSGFAQQQPTTPVKRPVKNPPQYPHIIDLENKEQSPDAVEKKDDEATAPPTARQMDGLLQAVESLATEMRSLVQEIRAMNLRQQTQLDITRVSGFGARIDGINADLRTVRERIGQLNVDEANLNQLMTRESLMSQTYNIGTLDREKTMEQIRLQHEAKLRYVTGDKERLQRTENELLSQLQYYNNLQEEAEKRIREAEDRIRRLESVIPAPKVAPKP